jgi:hypothetical protein
MVGSGCAVLRVQEESGETVGSLHIEDILATGKQS